MAPMRVHCWRSKLHTNPPALRATTSHENGFVDFQGLAKHFRGNRTGGIPASGSPVSGFVVLRLSASTLVPLPRTAAHGGQTIHSSTLPLPWRVRPRRFSSRLLKRLRTYPSTVANVLAWLCWKYPYQPRRLRFTPAMMACRLRPPRRGVWARSQRLLLIAKC